MSVNEKMTALADEVRRLSGSEDKLGIEAMTEKLAGVELNELFKKRVTNTLTDLTSDMLDGMTVIGKGSFNRCPLTTVDIADSEITEIQEYAFGANPTLASIQFPKGLTVLSGLAFEGGNTVMTYAAIPDGVTSLPFAVFASFSALKTVHFGENSQLKTIGNYLFSGCVALTHLKLPKTLTSVGLGCLGACKSVQYLDFSACEKIVSLASASADTLGIPDTAKIIVPASLYDEWIVASNWANFADHIVPDTIDGTWVFNDTISWERDASFEGAFVVDTDYDRLEWDAVSNSMTYYNGDISHAVYFSNGTWDGDYKTLNFGDTPIKANAEFLAFMYHNATKQEG